MYGCVHNLQREGAVQMLTPFDLKQHILAQIKKHIKTIQ